MRTTLPTMTQWILRQFQAKTSSCLPTTIQNDCRRLGEKVCLAGNYIRITLTSCRTNNVNDQTNQAILFTNASQNNAYGIPTVLDGGDFQAAVRFPSCWNRLTVDGPDYKSHARVHVIHSKLSGFADMIYRLLTLAPAFMETLQVVCVQRATLWLSSTSVPNSALR